MAKTAKKKKGTPEKKDDGRIDYGKAAEMVLAARSK